MTSRAGLRLFVDLPLAAGLPVPMSEVHLHYLRNVMRRTPGDEVRLFNGRDGEWQARIETLDKRGGRFAIDAQTRAQSDESGPDLIVAAIKRAPLEWMVEKATELGVASIVPVTTRRAASERFNAERLQAIATEAAEQCTRLSVPLIAPICALDDVLTAWPDDTTLYVLDETGRGAAIADAFSNHPKMQRASILIGPEGGFDDRELDAMRNLPFVNALDLGKRILRAETAALAALACFQAIAGDWANNRNDTPA